MCQAYYAIIPKKWLHLTKKSKADLKKNPNLPYLNMLNDVIYKFKGVPVSSLSGEGLHRAWTAFGFHSSSTGHLLPTQYQVEACELAYFMAVLDCFVFLPLTFIPLSLNSSRFGCSHLIACRVHRLNLQLLHVPIGYHKNNRSHALILKQKCKWGWELNISTWVW